MADSGSLYRLLSWLSPGYPVGAFSYSHGLEHAVDAGAVADAGALAGWIETVLLHGTGRTDGVFFREAHAAADSDDPARLDEVAELAAAFQPTAEFALESRAQGAAFLAATRAAWPAPALARLGGEAAYPVAVAVACAAHGIGPADGLLGYFHAFAANLVSAGVRLIPLGQTEGQRALAGLEPVVAAAGRQAMTVPLDDLGTAAPMLDLASMLHETQHTRLFRS